MSSAEERGEGKETPLELCTNYRKVLLLERWLLFQAHSPAIGFGSSPGPGHCKQGRGSTGALQRSAAHSRHWRGWQPLGVERAPHTWPLDLFWSQRVARSWWWCSEEGSWGSVFLTDVGGDCTIRTGQPVQTLS